MVISIDPEMVSFSLGKTSLMHNPKYQRFFNDPNELDFDKLALLDAIDSETARAAGRTAALRAPRSRNRTISNGSYSGRSGYGGSNGVSFAPMTGSGVGRSASARTPGQRFASQGHARSNQSQSGYSGSSGQSGYQNGNFNRSNGPIRRGFQI